LRKKLFSLKRVTILPDLMVFNFRLASDLTAQEEIEHGVFETSEGRALTPVLEASYEECSIGEFSAIMLCVISKNSSAEKGVLLKYTVLLFPESRQTLLDSYELAQSPAWPGLKIQEGELPMLPKLTIKWRCPANPVIMPGMPFNTT
jgi:hypothetical protein